LISNKLVSCAESYLFDDLTSLSKIENFKKSTQQMKYIQKNPKTSSLFVTMIPTPYYLQNMLVYLFQVYCLQNMLV